jgi:hypothetical protein
LEEKVGRQRLRNCRLKHGERQSTVNEDEYGKTKKGEIKKP